MKKTSPVFPELRCGMRVKRNFANLRGDNLSGRIIGFKDVVDVDAMEYDGLSEGEATVVGGAFVVLLDEDVRPRLRNDDGTIHVLSEWDVDYEHAEDWETE